MPLMSLTYQSEKPRAELLQELLPPLLANLSLARAQIAIDQIRTHLADPNRGQLVLITAKSESERHVAAAILVCHDDTSTMVHAGAISPSSNDLAVIGDDAQPNWAEVFAAISDQIDGELRQRSVDFLQWAVDPVEKSEPDSGVESVVRCCAWFGMEPLATLDYLSGPVEQNVIAPNENDRVQGDQSGPLRFDAIDWESVAAHQDLRSQPQGWSDLRRVIEATYAETADCPRLSEFRTAEQTMRGYRNADAFDERFWLTAIDHDSGQAVGCLILATHRGRHESDGDQQLPILEIVYMGLVPESRGRGLAKHLIAHAMTTASDVGCDRMILAVDRNNSVAGRLYRGAGLTEMFCEQVWCKSIS